MTFVDLTKAFDTVSREGFWKIMAKFGCPDKFIAMVRQFHDGMLARVQNDGEFSGPFPVTNGVKQGYVIASTLFSMLFSVMLTDAFQDGDNGIPIRCRFDGKLFNLIGLQAKSKVQTEVLDEFLFADDMAKGAPTDEKMQKDVDQVSDSCDSHDLTISIKTTGIVYISQHLESLTRSLPSQCKVTYCKWQTRSPTLEAHCLELCTLMMKSMLELPKLVQHLAGYVEVFGTEVESDLTQSWKYIDRWCCQLYYTHAKLRQFTSGMPKDWASSIQAVLENF